MNVLLAINDDYVEAAIVLLCSIFENTKGKISIIFLDASLSDVSKVRLNDYINKNGQEATFIAVDKTAFENAPERSGLSVETYFRLLSPWLLPEIDRVLYLDADMVCDGDLSEVWLCELAENYIAGVIDQGTAPEDLFHRAEIGLKKDSSYINGGLLLMDLYKIRRDYMQNDIWQIINRLGNKLCYQDQDIINILFEENIKVLPAEMNYVPIYKDLTDYWKYVFGIKRIRPILIHYFGNAKPWGGSYGYKFLGTYYKYCSKAGCTELQKEIKNNLKHYFHNSILQMKYLCWKKRHANEERLKERDMDLFWVNHVNEYVKYLNNLGYEKIAVYGIGRTGKALLNELRGMIDCVIDKYSNEKIDGIAVVRPWDYEDNSDLIIVSVWKNYDEIKRELGQFATCPIVSIEDFLYMFINREVLEKH